MSNAFKKEQRYIVLKIKDVQAAGITDEERAAFNVVCDKVSEYRARAGKPPLCCAVTEADWRCYNAVWGLIQDEHLGNISVEANGEVGVKLATLVDHLLVLTFRQRSVMYSANLFYIGDLVKHTRASLLKLPYIGKVLVDSIERQLTSAGLSLGMTVEWPPNEKENEDGNT